MGGERGGAAMGIGALARMVEDCAGGTRPRCPIIEALFEPH